VVTVPAIAVTIGVVSTMGEETINHCAARAIMDKEVMQMFRFSQYNLLRPIHWQWTNCWE